VIGRQGWFLAGLLALAACKSNDARGQPGPGGGGGPPGLPVEVARAREDTVVDAIQATGQVEAVQAIEVRPEVEGRIVEILMREGAEVAAGQPLFRIDDAELKAQVDRAAAQRDLARQALERTRLLVAQHAAADADLERAEAAARSAQADYDLLRVRLERTVVRAPFAGIVGQRRGSLGDYVTTGTDLAPLSTVDPQRVAFAVPERYATALRRGQAVEFRVAAVPGETFVGTVDFVSPAVELPARTILVKAVVPNRRRLLQPGMFVEARLATGVRPRAVIVPEEAILALQGKFYVWAVVDGKATRREVELGVRTPGQVEITSGVAAGEAVVVGGLELLQEGAPVAATEVPTRPAPGGDRPPADPVKGPRSSEQP